MTKYFFDESKFFIYPHCTPCSCPNWQKTMILSYRQVDFQILKCFHMWKQVSFFIVLKITNSYQTLFMSFSNGNQRWYVISIQTTVLKSPFLSLVLNKMIKEVKCKYFFLTQVTQFHWRAKSFKKLCSIYPHKDYRR